MPGDILNGHMSRQLQRIPFKSVTVRKPGIGKSELLLTDIPATPTFNPLNLIIQKHPLHPMGTIRNRLENFPRKITSRLRQTGQRIFSRLRLTEKRFIRLLLTS